MSLGARSRSQDTGHDGRIPGAGDAEMLGEKDCAAAWNDREILPAAGAPNLSIWIPGKPVNPKNVSGFGLWKHRRLIRTRREVACQAMLLASRRLPGMRWPWPADAPKVITFTAILPRLLDSDNLWLALSPIRDATGDGGLIGKTRGGRVKDGPSDGHTFICHQELARTRPVGVRVEVRLATKHQ